MFIFMYHIAPELLTISFMPVTLEELFNNLMNFLHASQRLLFLGIVITIWGFEITQVPP